MYLFVDSSIYYWQYMPSLFLSIFSKTNSSCLSVFCLRAMCIYIYIYIYVHYVYTCSYAYVCICVYIYIYTHYNIVVCLLILYHVILYNFKLVWISFLFILLYQHVTRLDRTTSNLHLGIETSDVSTVST